MDKIRKFLKINRIKTDIIEINVNNNGKHLIRDYDGQHTVYFLVNSALEIVYVGSSVSLSVRLAKHRYHKDFISAYAIILPSEYFMYSAETLGINHFSPFYNKQIPTETNTIWCKRAFRR